MGGDTKERDQRRMRKGVRRNGEEGGGWVKAHAQAADSCECEANSRV